MCVSLLTVLSKLCPPASTERRFTIPAVKRFSLIVRHCRGGPNGPKRFIEFRMSPMFASYTIDSAIAGASHGGCGHRGVHLT